jgi:hypothetical protein
MSNVSRQMRATTPLLMLALAAAGLVAVAAKDALWRLDHPAAGVAVASPSGAQVAEVRFMPEGSVVPYGSGVFVRPRWGVLHGVQSELAFAGYCGSLKPQWHGERRVGIACERLEGSPYLKSQLQDGTTVDVELLRKQAANPSIERTATSGLRPLVAAAHVKR